MSVRFYKSGSIADTKLIYVIICAKIFPTSWIFVRHRERETWELPAGHIEEGESPIEAAKRELYEETGAVSFSITPIFDYSAIHNEKKGHGRVYLAEIMQLGELPESEIGEIIIQNHLPGELTYPEIQTRIFQYLLSMTEMKDKE